VYENIRVKHETGRKKHETNADNKCYYAFHREGFIASRVKKYCQVDSERFYFLVGRRSHEEMNNISFSFQNKKYKYEAFVSATKNIQYSSHLIITSIFITKIKAIFFEIG
jgi:hypothetical protein